MEEQIAVKLTEKEWIKVMSLIQEAPLKDVLKIFISIDNQLAEHQQKINEPENQETVKNAE